MTWREYIEPIAEVKIESDNPSRALLYLFRVAGTKRRPSEKTTSSWIYDSRQCKVSSYFPDGAEDVKTSAIFKHFRNRPEATLKLLQKIFKDVPTENEVNCKTDSLDIFCWSLMNQFLVLLGFRIIEEPTEQTLARFKEATRKFNLEDFLSDPLTASTDELPMRIEGFLKMIDSDVIEMFRLSHSKESVYLKIKELHTELGRFISFAYNSPDWQHNFTAYRVFDELIVHHLRRSVDLYGEICNIETKGNIRLTTASPAFLNIDVNIINYDKLNPKKDSPK